MVKWTATTKDGSVFAGPTDDGSWLEFSNAFALVLNTAGPIVSLRLDGDKGGATIDNLKDGYIIGNKVIAALQGGAQIHLVGIGYWEKQSDTGRVKWYRADTMELQFTEARSTEDCGLFLIRNI